jgi:hypothetical protein
MAEGLDVDELDRRVRELAAHIHAATCELAGLVTEFQRTAGWSDSVVRSFPHWLAIGCGFSLRSGRDLVRVGEALESLPEVRASFARGELSLDKVRLLVEVAAPEDEHLWAGLARQLSSSQLARVCRNYRLALAAEDPARAEQQLARRGVWARYGDDGMLHLLARLTPDVGAQVLAVLDGLTGGRPLPEQAHAGAPTKSRWPGADFVGLEDQVPDPAEDRFAGHQADALAAVFQGHAEGGAGGAAQVVVHVDEAVLRGERRDGRCELENGPQLDPETARLLACQGELVPVIERNGSPLDVGRAQRLIPPRMKKALIARDRRCRVPGCNVPAERSDAHHLDPWILGGRTELGRSVCVCRFHHVRLHQGAFTIVEQPEGELHFFDRRGRRILASEPYPVDPEQGGAAHLEREHEARGLQIGRFTPLAQGAGYPFKLGPTVDAMLEGCGHRVARAEVSEESEAGVEPEEQEQEPDDRDEDAAQDVHALIAELRAEDHEEEPDPPWPQRDETDAHILRLLAGRGSVDAGELCRRLELPVGETVARLTRLELLGDVRQTAAGYGATASLRVPIAR